jgi:hypothetical protein
MNGFAGRLARLYARSLALYPPGFRAEFAEEASQVFNLGLQAAAGAGAWSLLRFALRELYDLPIALLALYARERNKSAMQKKLDQWFTRVPGSTAEVLLASLPFLVLFLLAGIFSLRGVEASFPAFLGLGLMGLLLLCLALIGIIGLLVRLPRWAMPYAGMLVSLGVFLVLMLLGMKDLLFSGQSAMAWELRMLTFEILYLLALAAALILLVWLARRTTLTTPFFEQVQKDRSWLSFAMYGGVMVLVLGMYEDVSEAGTYILVTLLPLLAGIWVFLHSRSMSWKLASLSIAITLAMAIALAANLRLADWVSPAVFTLGGLAITRSILSLLLTWLLCLAMLFLPLVLPRLPASGQAQGQMA